jgi:hypothetical protein
MPSIRCPEAGAKTNTTQTSKLYCIEKIWYVFTLEILRRLRISINSHRRQKISFSRVLLTYTDQLIYTYHSRFVPEGVVEASQIFFRDAHVLPKADVTGGKPIAVWSQSNSGVSAINALVAFYDIHGRKREVPFFYIVPDTSRDN